MSDLLGDHAVLQGQEVVFLREILPPQGPRQIASLASSGQRPSRGKEDHAVIKPSRGKKEHAVNKRSPHDDATGKGKECDPKEEEVVKLQREENRGVDKITH